MELRFAAVGLDEMMERIPVAPFGMLQKRQWVWFIGR
jgi:hypothetical protein